MSKINGLPIVLSAPSGGGKTTIAGRLLRRFKTMVRSVSCTTRSPRGKERNGRDYFFLNKTEFQRRIRAGHFLEWAKVHDHYYGTPVGYLKKQMKEGKDVLLVIDPQGAVSVRKKFPKGVYIFIVPSAWSTLKKRLIGRGTDNPRTRQRRLANARRELRYLPHYDYLVINDALSQAVRDVVAILRAERRKVRRVPVNTIPIFRTSSFSFGKPR